MGLTEATLVALFAAAIGGLISLLTLVISKEQTVSQFRQQWIDSLRSEIAQALASVADGIHRLKQVDRDPADYVLDEDYIRNLHERLYLIRLRLNPNDEWVPEIVEHLKTIESSIVDGEGSEVGDFWNKADKINKEVNCVVDLSQKLLKTEWKRVKAGENTYRITRWFISAALPVVLVLLLLVLFNGLQIGSEKSS